MSLEPVVRHALEFACQKLKERAHQPNEGQLNLPTEVVALLKTANRAKKEILKPLFNCLCGTSREGAYANALMSTILQGNPKAQPQAPQLAGTIKDAELYAIRYEAVREYNKEAKKQAMKKQSQKSNHSQHQPNPSQQQALQKQKEALQKHRELDRQRRKEEAEEEAHQVIDDAAANEEDEKEQEIYESYRAAMVEGHPHPDPIVETASLASIKPPVPSYQHHLPEIVENGELSDAQLETIVYANMRFNTTIRGGATAGFFLGDGAGVGKGRQIAALILEHRRTGGSRCLWVSVSNDLRYDAVRDLEDVGAPKIKVWPEGTNPLPKGRLDKHHTSGVLFVTYSLLVSMHGAKELPALRAGDLNQNTDARIPRDSRLEQIVHWLSGDVGGAPLIVLDECHKAKNLVAANGKSTQTGKAILKLQLNLPKAKVLYSSATGASEPNNLAYMIRLGCCGFKDMSELVSELNGSGLGSLEMFSMGLKATGCFVSRTLSYKGAEFQIAKLKMEPVFRVMYNRSCQFWHLLYQILKAFPKPGKKTMGLFYGAQQRFYRQMLMAAKVPETAKLSLEAVEQGMCVVIGLQSTGEANTTQVRDAIGGDVMDDFVSAPRQIMQGFLENHFPTRAGVLEISDGDLEALHSLVHVAVSHWYKILPADKQVKEDERLGRGPQLQAGATTAASADSDDEDLQPVETLSLDEVIARQREEAKRTGRFIDLTNMEDNDGEIRQARLAIKREEADEVAQERQAVIDKAKREKDRLSTDVRETEEAVAEAERELEEVRAALEECDAQVAGSSGAKRKRLRHSSAGSGATGHESSTFDDDATDTASPAPQRRRAAVIGLGEEDEDCSMVIVASESAPMEVGTSKKKRRSSAIVVLDSSDEEDEITSPIKSRSRGAGEGAPKPASPLKGTRLRDSRFVAPPGAIPGFDADDTACVVCGDTERGDEMLLCDGCDKRGAHHLYCLDPPLTFLPEEDQEWFCPKCMASGKGAQHNACKECGSTKGSSLMVTCHVCRAGPVHINCMQPPLDEVPRKYFCPKCESTSHSDGPRGASGFTSGRRPNWGGLLLKEKAALRKLEKAQEDLKASRQRRDPALRAGGRGAGANRVFPAAQPVYMPLSDSEAEAMEEDGSSDSDFCVLEQQSSPVKRPVKKEGAPKKDVKPKAKNAVYRHATANDPLGERWERDVDRMGPRAADEDHPRLIRIRAMLLRLWQSFELPANPLDQLTELLGGADRVAEMTGRKGQLIRDEEDGKVHYQHRRTEDSSQKMVNMREKQAFMSGEKLVAIISEAASTGISLQADKRVANQRRRCHLTLELPWSADKAIQQFGRSHRSNQASAPIYRIIVTKCAGEFRFAASAAKRLQSLGALLAGDRRAIGAGQDLKEFDCDNKWGLQALKRIYSDMLGNSHPMPGISVPEVPEAERQPGTSSEGPNGFYDYMKPRMAQVGMMHSFGRGDGPAGWKEDPDVVKKVAKWLNRVLAMTLEDQALLFRYFSDTLDAIILAARSRGEYDLGIQSVQASSITVQQQKVIHTDAGSDAKTFHTVLKLDRGCSWETALDYRDKYVEEMRAAGRPPSAKSGFYFDTKKHGEQGQPFVILATELKKLWRGGYRQFRVQRPNIGSSPHMQEAGLADNYKRVDDVRAERVWKYWFDFSARSCMHGSLCVRRKHGEECHHGMRFQPMHLISGAVLPVLKQLYSVAHSTDYGRRQGKKQQPKVSRAKLDNGDVIVGMELHAGDARMFEDMLAQGDFDAYGATGGLEIPYIE